MAGVEDSLDGHVETCQCEACRVWNEVSTMSDEEIRAEMVQIYGSEEAVESKIKERRAWIELLFLRKRGGREH